METGSSEAQPASGWSGTQIALITVLAVVACASVLGFVVKILGCWLESREMTRRVDSAVAELGLQKPRAALLQEKPNRRNISISANTLRGSEAYSATVPAVQPLPFVVQPSPSVVQPSPSVGGRDDESDSSDSDGSVESPRGTSVVQPRRAVPATQVQPSEIKPIILLRRSQIYDGNLGTAVVDQDFEISLDGSLPQAIDKKESPMARRTQNPSPARDSRLQINRYWTEDTAKSAPEKPPSQG
ncbi:predicted protein [Chaetomium globosum CBS 148.51]|uniref:Uncharacterized protein n=1 Tax=Chaetomium globosum (strain ATCC 6205 / CBS 148.51 / DSM 1962 / NBRC 6347 / NRRL 1970) TaxID=306901 RepID=Q2GQS8_CHAGB|nr:uncharacterized protein CHGG_09676 [Chaetomium globosum CBS 148.51]EAQ83272.1 predicted protein [Chaetomium globosum CBS 148.51]